MTYVLYGILAMAGLAFGAALAIMFYEFISDSNEEFRSANQHAQKLHLRHLAHINPQ